MRASTLRPLVTRSLAAAVTGLVVLIAACSGSVRPAAEPAKHGRGDFNRAEAVARIDARLLEEKNWREQDAVLSKQQQAGEAVSEQIAALEARRPRFDDLIEDALQVVDAQATDEPAFTAIMVVSRELVAKAKTANGKDWVGSADQKTQWTLARLLLEHHLQRPDFLSAVYLYRGAVDEDIAFWQDVLEGSPHRQVRADAAWTLMRRYAGWSNEMDLPPDKREMVRDQVVHYAELVRSQYADLVAKKTPGVDAVLTALNYSVGARLPDVQAPTLSRGSDSLAAYRGKVVLMNFWATWCAVCKQSHAELMALKAEMAGQPFEIIGVSADERPELVTTYLAQELKLPWPQWYVGAQGALLKSLGVSSYPTYLLLDADGTVQVRGGVTALESAKAHARKLVSQARPASNEQRTARR